MSRDRARPDGDTPARPRLSRRRFLRNAGGAAIGLAPLLEARAAFASALDQLAETATEGESRRGLYDLADGVIYLNHASIGTVPRVVREAHERYLRVCESNPWLYIWGPGWQEAWDDTRSAAAVFLGCDSDELAITHNTTEAFNLLAQGLPLARGDEVLFGSLNHVGASQCWESLAPRRGFRVRRFDFPVDRAAGMTVDELVDLHVSQIRRRTRVLVLPHIDNVLGIRHPVPQIAAAARERGVEFVAVDGAQSPGMEPVAVAELGVDFYATSGHKWLQAPKGLGLLYVRREVQSAVEPMWVTWGQRRWQGTARVFEDYGTRDLASVLCLGDAIRFQQTVDRTARARHHERLRRHARERTTDDPRLVWRSPEEPRLATALSAVEVQGRAVAELDPGLRQAGLFVRPFAAPELNTLRVSPNLMNDTDELDRLFDWLKSG